MMVNKNERTYTGVNTRWGDQICEGDIINTKPARYLVVKKGKEWKLKVIFTGMQGFETYHDLSNVTNYSGFILGNKYDNPELIDKEFPGNED